MPTESSAPRRWGYTGYASCGTRFQRVCPTQVGIHRRIRSIESLSRCLPHAGGDTPYETYERHCAARSAPRRWGYTVAKPETADDSQVCPTQVGIHPYSPAWIRFRLRLPHAGGDTPFGVLRPRVTLPSAPRRWGYTVVSPQGLEPRTVCPTQVGIHLQVSIRTGNWQGLPHAGGDTPHPSGRPTQSGQSAPRRWGYTRARPLSM